LWSSSLWRLLQSRIVLSVSGPNVFFSTIFSNT
jgi:hypothetical protein